MQAHQDFSSTTQHGIILIPFPGIGLTYFLDHTPAITHGRNIRVLESAAFSRPAASSTPSYPPQQSTNSTTIPTILSAIPSSPSNPPSTSDVLLNQQLSSNTYIGEIITISKTNSLLFIDDGLCIIPMLEAHGLEYRIIYPSWTKFESEVRSASYAHNEDEDGELRREEYGSEDEESYEKKRKEGLTVKLRLWDAYEFVPEQKRVMLEDDKWLSDVVSELLADDPDSGFGSGRGDENGEGINREGEGENPWGGNRDFEGENQEWGGEEGEDYEWPWSEHEEMTDVGTEANTGPGAGLAVDHCVIRALPLSFSNIIVNSPYSQNKKYIEPPPPVYAKYLARQSFSSSGSRIRKYGGRILMLLNVVLFCLLGYFLYRIVMEHQVWLESEAEGRLAMFVQPSESTGYLFGNDWVRNLLRWSAEWVNGRQRRGSTSEGLLESIERWVMVEKMLRAGKLGERFETMLKG